MNRLLNLSLIVFILMFCGCDNDKVDMNKEYAPFERNLSQEELGDLTTVSVNNYDIGWTCLVFTSPDESPFEEHRRLEFYLDMGNDSRIKEGSFNCKDTDSFKRYASFKCGNPNHGLYDKVKIKRIEGDHYEISYSYEENGKVFKGSYSGPVEHHFYAIDFGPECY